MKPHLIAAALLISAAFIVQSLYPTHAAAPDSAAASYAHGALHLTIPYHDTKPGAGLLAIDVLDPDDTSLAHSERRLVLTNPEGIWQTDLKLPNPVATEDLVWHRG